MRNVPLLAAAMVLTLSTIPVYGQHPAEIGVDAGWTGFDDDITSADAWRLDFRAGVYVWNWIEVEGQVTGSRASDTVGTVDLDTTLLTVLANGVFGFKRGKWVPYALRAPVSPTSR